MDRQQLDVGKLREGIKNRMLSIPKDVDRLELIFELSYLTKAIHELTRGMNALVNMDTMVKLDKEEFIAGTEDLANCYMMLLDVTEMIENGFKRTDEPVEVEEVTEEPKPMEKNSINKVTPKTKSWVV